MKQKPTHTFVYFALVMVFLFVIGILVVGMLLENNRPFAGDYFTASAILATNSAIANTLLQTPTFPYDPKLYAERQQKTFLLMTAGGPTEYAIFFATETALIATYEGTPAP